MALNNFTDNEAIEKVIQLRDELPLDENKPLKERWEMKDALAHVVNRLEELIEKDKKAEEKAREQSQSLAVKSILAMSEKCKNCKENKKVINAEEDL